MGDYQVRIKDRCTCSYCPLSDEGNFDVWINMGIDHIVPIRGQDYDNDDNKTVACPKYNTLKGDYVPHGTNRHERIADAKQYVQKKREVWQQQFDEMMRVCWFSLNWREGDLR